MRLFNRKNDHISTADLSAEHGAAAVEFAIVLPVLILFLFGIIEFSILLFDNAMVNHSVRIGARSASLFKPSYLGLTDDELNFQVAQDAAESWGNYLIQFGGEYLLTGDYLKIISDSGSGIQITNQAAFDNNIAQGQAFSVGLNQVYPYNFLVLFKFIGLGSVNLNTEVLGRRE